MSGYGSGVTIGRKHGDDWCVHVSAHGYLEHGDVCELIGALNSALEDCDKRNRELYREREQRALRCDAYPCACPLAVCLSPSACPR